MYIRVTNDWLIDWLFGVLHLIGRISVVNVYKQGYNKLLNCIESKLVNFI